MAKILEKIKKIDISGNFLKKIPKSAGIYLFLKGEKPVYIGKALDLRERVRTYFRKNSDYKQNKIKEESNRISFIEVSSEIEALLLEAELIKKFQPKFNIELKDDKSFLYIRITKEKYPRVLTARKKDKYKENRLFVGPFTSARKVRSFLKEIRKIFPYSTHKVEKKPCFYSQISLCNPCPSFIESLKDDLLKERLTKIYLKNIEKIRLVLMGNFSTLKERLIKEMESYSRKEEFEKALEIKKKIEDLDYITMRPLSPEVFLKDPEFMYKLQKTMEKKLNELIYRYFGVKKVKRIECFDVSHFSGSNPTASMITYQNSDFQKKFYRRFRIRQNKRFDDLSSLKEVAIRRKKHLDDWGKPDLIIVDGGVGQIKVFMQVFSETGIPILGIEKREEKLVIPTLFEGKNKFVRIKLKPPLLFLIQKIRDEAHRFAREYQLKLLKKSLINI